MAVLPARPCAMLALGLMLAACGGEGPPVASVSSIGGIAPLASPPVGARGGLIGATSGELIRRFGPPRLDVSEGDVRKLQFVGAAGKSCVLDVYLYPSAGGPARAAYVAARLADGRDTDQAACIAALRRN